MAFRKKLQVKQANDFVPLLAPSQDSQGRIDVDKVEVVRGVLPVSGIMQHDDGTLVPTIFVYLETTNAAGGTTTHTVAFNPLALAHIANVLTAMSLMLISDPDSLVKEIAASAGLMTEGTEVNKKFEGYL